MRSRASDRLCLSILRWLHRQHSQTTQLPIALSDSEFSVWPNPPIPIIYFLPVSLQNGLLYLPLFFHEFGHVLYACHKQEMNDLVRELQQSLEELLAPVSQRNDPHAFVVAERTRKIIENWHPWSQEIFCDAVGLTIGGPAFLNAFSAYFRMLGKGVFHQSSNDLEVSRHPVAWIRIQLLVDRAKKIGLQAEAAEIEKEWEKIAGALEQPEDYYGYYESTFLPIVEKTIDLMLIEANPNSFTATDTSNNAWKESSTPIHMMNEAWKMFSDSPEKYPQWESETIKLYLASISRIPAHSRPPSKVIVQNPT